MGVQESISEKISISFQGLKSTEAIEQYVQEKLTQHLRHYADKITGIKIVLRQATSHRGSRDNFRVDINVYVPGAFVRVEEVGDDLYALIDVAVDTLSRRLKRYHDKQSQWQGHKPWESLDMAESEEWLEDKDAVDDVQVSAQAPKILVRKTLEDLRPMEDAEAIEQMLLGGYDQFLFRSKRTGSYSMVYKRKNGGFGIVDAPATR